MRIGVVADCHIGNHQLFKGRTVAGINERCKLTIDAFAASYQLAISCGCTDFVVAGDLFDTERPSPMVVAAVMRVLVPPDADPNRPRPRLWVLKGNHDSNSEVAGDHALGPLSWLGDSVQVLEDWCITEPPRIAANRWRIVFLPFKPDAPAWVPELLPTLVSGVEQAPTIVFSHFGLSDADTPAYLKHGAIDADALQPLMAENGVKVWLSGDWHAHKVWTYPSGEEIRQIGALTPTGFDNPGDDSAYGSLLIVDLKDDGSHSITRHVLPGARFAYFPSKAAHTLMETHPETQNVTYLKVNPADWAACEEELTAAKSTGRIRDSILGASESPRAKATGSELETEIGDIAPASPEEALEAYIARMELDSDTRQELLTLCRAYLQTGTSKRTS